MRRLGLFAVAIGGAALVTGAIYFAHTRRQKRLNGLGLAAGSRGPKGVKKVSSSRSGDKTTTHYFHSSMPIDKRVSIIQDLVFKASKNAEMRDLALAITGEDDRYVTVRGRNIF